MHLPPYLLPLLLALTPTPSFAKNSPEKILLKNVKTLTLRDGLKTTHNRISPVPQLKCIGGTAKGLYEVDVLRCKNQGSSYDEDDIQWTCTADLPLEFKLGSTDVMCEGFTSSTDPYVLKGSCGVEYRLMLTELGEQKYGKKSKSVWGGDEVRKPAEGAIPAVFWALFIAVVCWMVYSAFLRDNGTRPGGNDRPGFFGGGGGGGGNDDPPPPYDYHPPPRPKTTSTSTRAPRAAPAPAQEGWRPGFWTGALGGAAAGYAAGNRAQNQQQQPRNQGPNTNFYNGYDNGGEGSSRWGGGGDPTRPSASSNSSSSFGLSRHESSGFGGTSRR